jgi:hypothetical protein
MFAVVVAQLATRLAQHIMPHGLLTFAALMVPALRTRTSATF